MTPAQQVALDAMRAAWGDETAERMLRAVDGELERLVAAWAEQLEEEGVRPLDHACAECRSEAGLDSLSVVSGFVCLFHRGKQLLSPPETPPRTG